MPQAPCGDPGAGEAVRTRAGGGGAAEPLTGVGRGRVAAAETLQARAAGGAERGPGAGTRAPPRGVSAASLPGSTAGGSPQPWPRLLQRELTLSLSDKFTTRPLCPLRLRDLRSFTREQSGTEASPVS